MWVNYTGLPFWSSGVQNVLWVFNGTCLQSELYAWKHLFPAIWKEKSAYLSCKSICSIHLKLHKFHLDHPVSISCNHVYLWIFYRFTSIEAKILTLANGCHNAWTMYNIPSTLITKQKGAKRSKATAKGLSQAQRFLQLERAEMTNEIPTSMTTLQSITLIAATYVEFFISSLFSLVLCGFWGSNLMKCCAVASVTSPSWALLSPPVTNKSSRAITSPSPGRNNYVLLFTIWLLT